MAREVFKYTGEKVTVVWKPKLCIHSAICFKGLPGVFDPQKRPWVNIDGASAEKIREQVHQCPSGALSLADEDEPTPMNTEIVEADTQIQIRQGGPLLIKGTCLLTYPDGRKEIKKGNFALCRCGASSNKPYCDNSHRTIGFKG